MKTIKEARPPKIINIAFISAHLTLSKVGAI